MQCPRCHTHFELPPDLTETGCPECLWVPVDTLKDALRMIGSTDETAIKHVLAYQGQGMVMNAAELGFLSVDDATKWTERLIDAAGIEWEHVEVSSSHGIELEIAEEESDGSGDDGDGTDPSR